MSGNSDNVSGELDLLGYRLGLLSDAEMRAIEGAIASDDRIARQCAEIDAWLTPLAADDCAAPDGLTGRIEARIDVLQRNYEFPATVAAGDAAATAGSGPFLSGRDLLALAAVITLFVGVFLPSYRQARHHAQQAACANNLRTVAGGLGGYTAMNSGQMPYVGPTGTDAVWYHGDRRSAPASRNLFMLVRGRYVPVRAFVDPGSATDRPMDERQADASRDGFSPRSNSYSSLLQMSVKPWTRYQLPLHAPIAAGMTPLVDTDGRLRSDGRVPANSPNHGVDRGQNVLRADYSATFDSSPISGVGPNDDIYRMNGIRDGGYTGRERPSGMSDSFLTP